MELPANLVANFNRVVTPVQQGDFMDLDGSVSSNKPRARNESDRERERERESEIISFKK